MTFFNVFAYIEIAAGIIAAVQAIHNLKISATNPLSSAELQAIAMPVLAGVQQIAPTANISPALVTDIANAIADAVNAYYKSPKP
jgi:hypothetical protein